MPSDDRLHITKLIVFIDFFKTSPPLLGYPLVNIQKTMENHHFQWEIFHSYVKLPEGKWGFLIPPDFFRLFFIGQFRCLPFEGPSNEQQSRWGFAALLGCLVGWVSQLVLLILAQKPGIREWDFFCDIIDLM